MSQNLRKFTTLAAADSYWKNAKRTADKATAGDVIVRELDQMDARYVKAFTALLEAEATIASPMVDMVARTGTFANSVTVEAGDDDRSVRVVNTLTRVYSVSTIADLAALTSRPAQENEILNLFGFERGEGDFAAFVWENLNAASRDECMALADSDLCKRVLFADGLTAWATATTYSIGDKRTVSGVPYFCIVAHTSDVWATDLAANKWRAIGSDYATSTGYKANEVVASGGVFYRWIADDTSTTASADIADGSLVVYWQYAKLTFEVQSNNAGKFTVAFQQLAWSAAWASKRQMGEDNSSGYRLSELHEIGGAPVTQRAALLTAAKAADTDRVLTGVRIEERAGQLSATRRQAITYSGVDEADAVVIKYKAAFGTQMPGAVRVWWRRSTTAKGTLTGTSGKARTDGTIDTVAYTHVECTITDHGDGAYSVYQYLIANGGTAAGTTFFSDSYTVTAYKYRSKDALRLKITMTKQVACFAREDLAHAAVKARVAAGHPVVRDSVRIQEVRPFFYRAQWLEDEAIVGSWS